MKRKWEHFVAENTATLTEHTDEGTAGDTLSACEITCHSGGPSHRASVCRDCPLFVSWHPAADSSEVTIRCWWHRDALDAERPRRVARGSGLHRIVVPACSSCGTNENVDFHPSMSEVPICDDCLDRSRERIPYTEIGAGD